MNKLFFASLAILSVVACGGSLDEGSAESAGASVNNESKESAATSVNNDESNKPVQAGRSFRDCDACPEMVEIPTGTFMMGSLEEHGWSQERPIHEVTIEKRYAIGKYEVTFDEWDACVADGGCDGYSPDDNGWGRGRQPVISISLDDAHSYVDWLAEKTGEDYRLPSEAEWEYAARAGTDTLFWWGDEIGVNNAACNRCGSEWDTKQPAPVGTFKPNPFGLYDVVGNVTEWVEDCASDGYENTPTDGSANLECTGANSRLNVMRGGGFSIGETETLKRPERSSARLFNIAMDRTFGNSNGFRVAKSLD